MRTLPKMTLKVGIASRRFFRYNRIQATPAGNRSTVNTLIGVWPGTIILKEHPNP